MLLYIEYIEYNVTIAMLLYIEYIEYNVTIAMLLYIEYIEYIELTPAVGHFQLTTGLLAWLETLCQSPVEVSSMRGQPSYQDFHKRCVNPNPNRTVAHCYPPPPCSWNTQVYFQMRLQSITTPYEKALAAPLPTTLDAASGGESGGGMSLAASTACQEALARCWADDVYLHLLVGKFFKLSLQIVERYRSWILNVLLPAAREGSAKNAKKGAVAASQDGTDAVLSGLLPYMDI